MVSMPSAKVLARVAKDAWDAVFRKQTLAPAFPPSADIERESRKLIDQAIWDGM